MEKNEQMAAEGIISPTYEQQTEWTYREKTKLNTKGSKESLFSSSLF